MGDLPASGGYDAARGARVITWAKAFLDDAVPLASGSWADVTELGITDGALTPALGDSAQFAGFGGSADKPDFVLLKNNGLHIQIMIDPAQATLARPIPQALQMSGWNPRFPPSWIAKIRSPASMLPTRSWPMATGWAS